MVYYEDGEDIVVLMENPFPNKRFEYASDIDLVKTMRNGQERFEPLKKFEEGRNMEQWTELRDELISLGYMEPISRFPASFCDE